MFEIAYETYRLRFTEEKSSYPPGPSGLCGTDIHIWLLDNGKELYHTHTCEPLGMPRPLLSEQQCLIHNEHLVVFFSGTICIYHLPELQLCCELEKVQIIHIVPFGNDLIVHDEVEILRININGDILWTFSGADILVSLRGENCFRLHKDHIEVCDFTGRKYRIACSNGQEIL